MNLTKTQPARTERGRSAALIGGVALSVLAFAAAPASVEAKPVKHHRGARAVGPTRTELQLEAKVQGLQAQVQSLEARLDAQAQAQQHADAQIQSAQAQAQAAQTAAQTAQTQLAAEQTQIETIPGQVETAAKANAPKPGWWNNTTVGGTMFSDLSYISNENDGVKNGQSGPGFDIKRAYLTIDHRFNDVFSANLTTDFIYDSNSGATQLFIKKAYFDAKLADALTIRAGGADLPWVPFVEGIYGYRYVDHVLIDNYGFGTSADWGVHAFGSLFNHVVNYQVSVVNGSGYKAPDTGTANRTDAMDVEGRLSATFDHFTVAVGGYDGKRGKDIIPTGTFYTAERFDALAAYTSDRFRIGAEYMWATHWNDVLQSTPAKTNSSEAWSAFASFNFTPQIAIFGRYDWIKPDTDTAPDFTSNYFNVGVSYKPIKQLDIALAYKHDSVIDGLLSTQNGTIGTLNATGIGKGTYSEIGIFTQVKY